MDLLQVTGAENRLTQLGCITKASPQVVDMSRHSIRRVDNRSEVDAMYSIVVYDPNRHKHKLCLENVEAVLYLNS